VPDWIAEPQAGAGGAIPSVVLPAVDAPPKGVIELLQEAFAFYKQHLKILLITAAVLYVPGALVSSGLITLIKAPLMVSASTMEASARDLESGAVAGAALGGVMVALLGILALAVLGLIMFAIIVPLTQSALTVAAADRLLGGERGWQDYWKVVVARLGKIAGTIIPAAILVFVGLMMLLVPGAVLLFFFSLTPMVIMLEGKGGVAALKRSFELVKSDWLRVAVVCITFGVGYIVASLIGGLLIPDRFVFFDQLIGHLFVLVLLPFPIVAAVLLYLDIRRTKEHVDRDTLQAELAAVRTPA